MKDKPYHHGDLRNALIEAGIEVINSEGEKQFSLRKVAASCGVSHAAPYSHFKDKEDLLSAMQAHVVNLLTDQMQDIIDSYVDKTETKLLIDLGKCYVLFFVHHPQYYSFLFTQSSFHVNLDLQADGSDSFPPFELFKVTALPILKAYGLPEHRWEDATIACFASVQGLSAIANMKNIHYSKSWEDKIEDLLSDVQN